MTFHFTYAGPALLLAVGLLVAVSPIFLMIAVAMKEQRKRERKE
jgi:hypothetical protein